MQASLKVASNLLNHYNGKVHDDKSRADLEAFTFDWEILMNFSTWLDRYLFVLVFLVFLFLSQKITVKKNYLL